MTSIADKMCFGLTEELDRQSFQYFLELSGNKDFSSTLAARLTSAEILAHVDNFTALLRKHFSEEEYHRLFLQDRSSTEQHGEK